LQPITKQYELIQDADITELIAHLKQSLKLQATLYANTQIIYYDSFDWRLYQQQWLLAEILTDTKRTLQLFSLDDKHKIAASPAPSMPRFAWDCKPGLLRDKLTSVLEMRALLPLCRIDAEQHQLSVLNGDEKTLVRLDISRNTLASSKKAKPKALPATLTLQTLKGYSEAAADIETALNQSPLLQAQKTPLALQALTLLKLRPGSYSSKLKLKLQPDMPGSEALRAIFRELLHTMQVNENGTRKDLDSEFLHDFRVAVRRTRSALTQVKGVFQEPLMQPFKEKFAWLGQITSPTRDMDVYLLSFDTYRAMLPADIQPALDPLRDFLIRHQKQEQKTLAAHLGSQEYKRFSKNWQAFLGNPPPQATAAMPNADRPIADVASERIWKIYRRVLKEGRAITPDSPAEDLHELRKTCKKLRYLMEFFQSLYPKAEISALIKVLKGFQENLGDFQDFEVQTHQLSLFATQMQEEGVAQADTLLAMGRLSADLSARQQQARAEFAERFDDFSGPEHCAAFAKLFAPNAPVFSKGEKASS
jgi:CHAD domain-containing protein